MVMEIHLLSSIELRVAIIELRVTKVELRVTKVELRVAKVELQVAKVELRVKKVELRVTKDELRVKKVELRVKKVELRVKKFEFSRGEKDICCIVAAKLQQQQTTSLDHNTQTEARDTIVGQVLTPTKYKGKPVGVVINRDIVTSPYNPNKVCHRLIYYTSTTTNNNSINDQDLLRTPPHTSPVSIESKEAMQAAILAERPDTPYQPQHRSRSKMKAKRQTDPNL
ncbi:unnamed protein product [Mytilus edulis]|uniref:Uncharacterized protein n=1 Tax=Mytilus edulis TaxID=6550 RepID=A0A8S3T8D0_MYTED|nr:unnamed protein product [Mytilus edulis]